MNSNERPNLQKALNKKAEGGVLILTFLIVSKLKTTFLKVFFRYLENVLQKSDLCLRRFYIGMFIRLVWGSIVRLSNILSME